MFADLYTVETSEYAAGKIVKKLVAMTGILFAYQPMPCGRVCLSVRPDNAHILDNELAVLSAEVGNWKVNVFTKDGNIISVFSLIGCTEKDAMAAAAAEVEKMPNAYTWFLTRH